MVTTIKIDKDDLEWWKRCCKVKGMTSWEVFSEIRRQCKLHHQRELYNSLPMPSDYKKPLRNIKLDKKYTKK